jgi:hypothetical protein
VLLGHCCWAPLCQLASPPSAAAAAPPATID